MTNEVRELFELASGDMSSLYNYGSRAASTTQEQDTRVTEMINGLLVSKRAKKRENEPEIIDLQEYARSGKAASIPPAVNEVAELFNAHFGSV